MEKAGILLLNLGTPSAPTVKSVRKYLREFLSDPYVIDLPWLLRTLLVNAVILPLRPKQSAHAYQQIWDERGSPLRYHSEDFRSALAETLGDHYVVTLGMRYGEPSIKVAVEMLAQNQCKKILVMPLFPQYSAAATRSAIAAAEKAIQRQLPEVKPQVVPYFFDDTNYQQAMADVVDTAYQAFQPDYTLFSYHGLPEQHISKAGCQKSQCNREASCLTQKPNIKSCYRAQCFATTQALATQLNFSDDIHTTVFQSRLGRTQWIKPYLDAELVELRKRGINKLMIVCPSFVADCLETLEEIGIRARKRWQELGGQAFYLAPCLNTNPKWVAAMAGRAHNLLK